MARAEIVAPEIGQRIAELRKGLGLSVAELAKALGITPFTLREIEAGRLLGHYLKLANMARLLGTTPNHILGFNQLTSDEDAANIANSALATMEGLLLKTGKHSEEEVEAMSRLAMRAAEEWKQLSAEERMAAEALAAGRLRRDRKR